MSGSIARSSAGLEAGLLTLSLFSSSDFMASECVLRSKLLHCAFLAIRDLVTSPYFILQGFIPRDTKSSICLHVFGSVVSWVLGYLSLLFCIPPDRVGCVAVTNGPTIYLSGLLYKEIFFFLHSLTQSSWATAQLTDQVFERRENKHGESHTEFQSSYSDVTYLFPVTFPQYGQSHGQVCHQ